MFHVKQTVLSHVEGSLLSWLGSWLLGSRVVGGAAGIVLHSCIYVSYTGWCGVGPNALKWVPTREMRNRSRLHGKPAAKLQGRCALLESPLLAKSSERMIGWSSRCRIRSPVPATTRHREVKPRRPSKPLPGPAKSWDRRTLGAYERASPTTREPTSLL
jgi:hypothetical protein